jgi:hypothetical protein
LFWSRYPRSKLVHERVCQSFGTPRGLQITPLPGPAVEPPEIVHENSAVFPSQKPGIVFVVEWTGPDETELHHVTLT